MTSAPSISRSLGALAVAAGWLGLFLAIGGRWAGDYALTLHADNLPKANVILFHGMYTFFGLLAAAALTLGLAGLVSSTGLGERLERAWSALTDRQWIAVSALAVLVLSIGVHFLLLHGMPLTDDEGAYRFSADLLASGRLTGPPRPMAEFFDRTFLINGERVYSQYFLGWPALLVPGVLLGVPWLMNPLYAALTVPPVFWIARRVVAPGAGRLATVLLVASPLLLLLAGTGLSHTSCLMALSWATSLALRSRDDDAPLMVHSALAGFFCLAFLIRPLTAVGLGVPLIAWWALGLWGRPAPQTGRRVLAFALPALLGASVFFAINQAQHGDPLQSGYAAYWDHVIEVDFRNTNWKKLLQNGEPPALPNLRVRFDERPLAILGVALYRLNYAWLGWPLSFAFLIFARFRGEARLFFGMLLCYLSALLFSSSAGVDTIGPVHFSEGILPCLVLTVAGYAALSERATDPHGRWLLRASVTSLIGIALVIYLPVRWGAVARVADAIRRPDDVIEAADLDQAVIFYKKPFAKQCSARHFYFSGPPNDPDLSAPILYALDLGRPRNRELMRAHFPDRPAYRLVSSKEGCGYTLAPMWVGPSQALQSKPQQRLEPQQQQRKPGSRAGLDAPETTPAPAPRPRARRRRRRQSPRTHPRAPAR